MSKTKEVGNRGEELAVKHLLEDGYAILERNYTNKLGEVDIIARSGEIIVFVEVKTRSASGFAYPRESVDRAKQHRYVNLANSYLVFKRLAHCCFRFDVVEVIGDKVCHIEDAFRA